MPESRRPGPGVGLSSIRGLEKSRMDGPVDGLAGPVLHPAVPDGRHRDTTKERAAISLWPTDNAAGPISVKCHRSLSTMMRYRSSQTLALVSQK